jgi:hypothetical protein
MEVLWGVALALLVWTWRVIGPSIAALFGVNLLVLEVIRIAAPNLTLRRWYVTPTQVGRVIPKPLLHPVPMLVMAVIVLSLTVAAVLWRRRSAEPRR